MVDGLNTRIPQPAVPFVDGSGGLSREWLYYMIALLNRTGGNAGISSGDLQAAIESIEVETAMADVYSPAPSYALTASDVMSDPPAAPSALGLLALALSGDVCPQPLNPILAGLFVA